MPRVLALSGSLRKDSLNNRLLHALPPLAPALDWDVFDELGALPLYDQDIDSDDPPPAVARLRAAITAADGLVVVTPEYNHSIPGVLKNAIDWASRPRSEPPLTGKSIAVLVATPSRTLGYRALADTTRVLGDLGNIVVPQPENVVQIARSVLASTPDGASEVTDDTVRARIRIQLDVLAELLEHDVAGLMHRAIVRHTHRHLPSTR